MYSDSEKKQIEALFDKLLMYCNSCKDSEKDLIKKAYKFAYEAHKKDRRRTGEPFIIHPIHVAIIVADNIGLDAKSIASAILHDIVEDTEYTLETLENMFGSKIAVIVDGLTKLKRAFDEQPSQEQSDSDLICYSKESEKQHSLQAENFRKLLLTLSDDVRVILIKLADRLHNMRTLDAMPPNKKVKICSETLFIYAPLAHRLGLYSIKTELEDLSFKFRQLEAYNTLQEKIKFDDEKNYHLINRFAIKMSNKLTRQNIKFDIDGRPKSVYSTWKKMKSKNVTFEEVYDFLAVRIIFDPLEGIPESTQCWNIYALIAELYNPKPNRIRDWVSKPKANGYEALHGTFMGNDGRWIEVQIRSRRMHEVAEKGYAAHWKYKEHESKENELDKWLGKVRDILDNHKANALEFLDDFKLSLFSDEILVFTPKGKIITLPKGASVLDFAFEIHTELAYSCIGAKINHQMMPRSHILNSGDQVEILSSKKQQPEPEWLNFVITAKAQTGLKNAFKTQRKKTIKKGKKILEDILEKMDLSLNSNIFKKIFREEKVSNKDDLYYKVGAKIIDEERLTKILKKRSPNKFVRYWQPRIKITETEIQGNGSDSENNIDNIFDPGKPLILDDGNFRPEIFEIASCCNPIPGDEVIGYKSPGDKIIIHKISCENAIMLSANYGDLVVKVEWIRNKLKSFLARIKLKGMDKMGIVNNITNVISKELNVNMRSIFFEGHDDIFNGEIDLYVHDTQDLQILINNLMRIEGVKSVRRIETKE